jgi:hypothetical protein
MAKDPRPANNHVAEWFGHRVYPTVTETAAALADQQNRCCPFLTIATAKQTQCVKTAKSIGVCTISSTSNGQRQDWLVCPFRSLSTGLVESVARRLFTVPDQKNVVLKLGTTLNRPEVQAEVQYKLDAGDAVFVYVQTKLGGEVSLRATARSPELSFDLTLVELISTTAGPAVNRYAILEIQTMDFHGSYQYAVKDLDDSLRLHAAGFHGMVRQNVAWVANSIEGPNIANVFKRTLYQMLLKFRLAGNGACIGAALAIPTAVWDSWQPFLGAPDLKKMPDGTYRLAPTATEVKPHAWLYIFDIDASSQDTPNPIVISKVIGTDVDAVAHYAFKAAPDAILAEGGSHSLVLEAIRVRLGTWWAELDPGKVKKRRLPKIE